MIFLFLFAMVFASDQENDDDIEKMNKGIVGQFRYFGNAYGKLSEFPFGLVKSFESQFGIHTPVPATEFPFLHFAVMTRNAELVQVLCDKLIKEGREDLLETKNENVCGSTALTIAAMQYKSNLNKPTRNPLIVRKFLQIVKILIRAKCSFVTNNEMGNCALDFLRSVREKIMFEEFKSTYQNQGIVSTGLNLESFLLRLISASYESRNRLDFWLKMSDEEVDSEEKNMYNANRVSFYNTWNLRWQNTIKNPQTELTREYLKHLTLYFKGGFKYQRMMIKDETHGKSVLEKNNEEMKALINEEYDANCGKEEKLD